MTTFQAEEISHTIVKTVCLKLSQPGSRKGTLSMICLKEHVTFAGPVVWKAFVRIKHKAMAYVELTHFARNTVDKDFSPSPKDPAVTLVTAADTSHRKPDCLGRGRSEARRRNNRLKAKSSHPRDSSTTLRIPYSISYPASRQQGFLSQHRRE